MTPIVRTVGLLPLLPFAITIARYATVPFAPSPGPAIAILVVYGGYIAAVGYVIAFLTFGYHLSKHRIGSFVQAGTFCAAAYFVLQVVLASIMWWLVSGLPVFASIDFAAVARISAYLLIAFGLGAAGFLLHARINAGAL